jgi:CsoR family transcriptional regulator, copper-sensing transcriptional repressor
LYLSLWQTTQLVIAIAHPMKPSIKRQTIEASAVKSAYRAEHEKEAITRLRKIEGQVRGLVLMIESGRPCEDIATQMTAARKALDKAFYRMMVCSMIEAAHASDNREKTVSDIERSARLLEKLA